MRADANHPRLEAADVIAGATVAAELLIQVTDKADLPLLGQELRRTPVLVGNSNSDVSVVQSA